MIQSVNLPPSAHTVTSSAHCSTLQPSAACSQPSSAYPVHTLQQPLHLQCTLQPCIAMYNYLQPTFSAHCSQLQPSTTIYTAAILSSAHCSYTIQCTLQFYYPVHTAAMYSYLQPTFSTHCSYTIQCTLQLHYLVPILYSTSSAPLDHHRVSLYHYWPTSRTVSRH